MGNQSTPVTRTVMWRTGGGRDSTKPRVLTLTLIPTGRDHQSAPSHDQVPAADPGLDPGHDPSHGPSQRPGPDQAAESVRSQAQEADQIKSDIIMIIIIIFCNNKYVPYQHELMTKISTINYRKLNTFQ